MNPLNYGSDNAFSYFLGFYYISIICNDIEPMYNIKMLMYKIYLITYILKLVNNTMVTVKSISCIFCKALNFL